MFRKTEIFKLISEKFFLNVGKIEELQKYVFS